ncbi:MAG: aldo/keto reductase [Novosphingobium sp.]|nr:aldo/keto reductase [Novosphingobium sp.]
MADHPSIGGVGMVLGGNVFGWTIDAEQSFPILDAFYEAGGRMIDSAEGYSAWVPGNKGGESEEIIGQWLDRTGVRKEMLIGTKTGMAMTPECLQESAVRSALEGSLERLRTDYLDLYYVHMDNGETPLEDIAGAFDATVKSGHVRELGLSNMVGERLDGVLAAADRPGGTPFTVMQPKHNFVSRAEFSGSMREQCKARGFAVFPYFSLASGLLTGKFSDEEAFASTPRSFTIQEFSTPAAWEALKVLEQVANETGAKQAQVALAWLTAQDGVTAPIVSATSPQQLAETMGFITVNLSADQLARLDAAFPG